ncbi:hypothetical protein BKA58DRAFT_439217 [Alternaria rosae]|uniref:uncharacterized protein n=1 Tax=Alternaria rosae TaxID=1187941 RepID=UPI001E8D02BE|nr:uncharacterized protein BKA58DRAFT_439217 [Alternaria rosae]KAH6873145.1 hypothetical protein BKA58DRAFT_439217 [Alternaria rosae]
MPAEIRNEVYQYLLPDVTSLRDVTGLLCACKQIRQELSSMIVAESQIVMNRAVQKSIDLVQVAYPTTEVNAVIGAPKIQTHSHLCNVNVNLGLRDTDSQTTDTDVPTVYFDEVFSSFRELLSLHLPYVTINVPATIANDASIADPELRRRLLDSCVLTFRRLEETPGVTLNVQHVVFEIRNQKWDTAALVYNPIVVFLFYRNSIDFDSIPEAMKEEVNSLDNIWKATPQECVDAYYEHESAQGVKLCSTVESTSEFNHLKCVCKQLYKGTKHLSLLHNDIVFAQDNVCAQDATH